MLSIKYLILFCKDVTDIVLIYHLLRKHIFVKGIKDTWTEVSSNLTTYWKNTQKQLMVYQRGKARDSGKLDRVRIELTVSRDLLRKRRILTLEDMIRDIKFSEAWQEVLRFEHFTSPNMPEDRNYLAKDREGNFDAFQLEYLERNKSEKDMAKCMESLKELDSFKDRLSNVVKEFDEKWKWPEYLCVLNSK